MVENAEMPASDKPDPVDDLTVTHHVLRTDEGDRAYTARTGRIVLREEVLEDGVFSGWKAKAQLSITAYALDDADVLTRPIAFVFNGGPGSSSIWLHMGLLGPRRADMGEPGSPTPPPYALVDNPDSLLRVADLVFIDPISTGHSRAVEGGKPADFHGYGKDVEQVAELIRVWCTRTDRWMSPKFLIGESYGTIRAVGVAEHLLRVHAMALNGLVLISSVLDLGSQDFDHVRIDEACLQFLPTYAAIAHYHGLRPDTSLPEVLREAEEFAAGPYRHALARGRRLPAQERAAIVADLARISGLSPDYIDRCDLRPEHWRFCGELLRDRGLAVGRIDGRFTAPLASRIAEHMDADPSMDAMSGPYAAAWHHYLRHELGSTQELPYRVHADIYESWQYKEFNGRPVNVTDKLERVMRANPAMRVRFEYGYYDLATPYAAAEDTVAHLRLPQEAFDRIEHAHFETGHMPYVGDATRAEEARGIAEFVRASSPST